MTPSVPDVSRETLDVLASYAEMLLKWNKTHNLISRQSEADIWTRHIADSVQIYHAAPIASTWLDIGSGAGLPGIISAIMAKMEDRRTKFTLIEANQKKAAFLRAVAIDLDLEIKVENQRIESVDSTAFDVISARALASLDQLLFYAERFRGPQTICLFPKGRTVEHEIEEAQKNWNFKAQAIPSKTEDTSIILRIQEFDHVRPSRRNE